MRMAPSVRQNLMLAAYLLALCTLSFSATAQTAAFNTFDPPGLIETRPASMNGAGAITGYYVDAQGASHGFMRSATRKHKYK